MSVVFAVRQVPSEARNSSPARLLAEGRCAGPEHHGRGIPPLATPPQGRKGVRAAEPVYWSTENSELSYKASALSFP